MRKPIFEAKDTHPQFEVAAQAEATEDKYVGPERRRDNRRTSTDRRGEVRFDLNSTDRRQKIGGRRDGDAKVNFW